ncbi:hypothetical protein AcV5_002625 [Taiwanofungus camphoratus]|nr:hypothetical protein AcV5_002625 [Antrodia cinnamomea]
MATIGLASSIISVIQLTGSISKICVEYAQAVKNAPDDIQKLQHEIELLKFYLENVEESASRHSSETSEKLRLKQLLEVVVRMRNETSTDVREGGADVLGVSEIRNGVLISFAQ